MLKVNKLGKGWKKPHYLSCGHLLINIKRNAEIHQLEGDLQLAKPYWEKMEVFQQFGLKYYLLSRFCSFPEAEENPHQVTCHLAKPTSETTNGNHAECSDQATFPMTHDNSWKIKVFYRKKLMSGSFPSSTAFMCLTTFHRSKCAECPPASTKCFQ